MVAHSGSHASGWFGAHLNPKRNVSSFKDASKQNSEMSELKFAGVYDVKNTPRSKLVIILMTSFCWTVKLKQLSSNKRMAQTRFSLRKVISASIQVVTESYTVICDEKSHASKATMCSMRNR